MALFKILKGNKSNLPSTSTEGWVYVTQDTADMHIFISDSTKIQLNADKANALRNSSNALIAAGSEIQPVYFSNGVPATCDPYNLFYIEGTGTTAGTWLGTSSKISSYYAGLTILYKIPIAGNADGTTLNINGLGAVTVVDNATTAISTRYPVNAIILLTYTVDGSTAYWKHADYNTNTNTQMRIYRQSYTGEYPLLACRTTDANIATPGTESSYEAAYGVVSLASGKTPTLQPSTGRITMPANIASTSTTTGTLVVTGGMGVSGNIYADSVYGAVWNDYAEYRKQKEKVKPGYCVASSNSGEVYKTTEKFQACDGIVSDTFGFAIGETDKAKTPLAVAGRVLAYAAGNRADYQAGDTVCAGPDGKVVKMTREEIKEYPDRIVGIVSEIPEYETWGSGNVKVDGRIWIKVK